MSNRVPEISPRLSAGSLHRGGIASLDTTPITTSARRHPTPVAAQERPTLADEPSHLRRFLAPVGLCTRPETPRWPRRKSKRNLSSGGARLDAGHEACVVAQPWPTGCGSTQAVSRSIVAEFPRPATPLAQVAASKSPGSPPLAAPHGLVNKRKTASGGHRLLRMASSAAAGVMCPINRSEPMTTVLQGLTKVARNESQRMRSECV